MTGYTKLFGSIITSTIWREKNETRILWITMLALKNKAGIVEGSVPGLADMARLSLEDTLTALAILRDPDPYSRTKEFEGRRIVDVDGGWLILNHEKWRAKMNTDERREYLKIKQREHRARDKAGKVPQNPSQKYKAPPIPAVNTESTDVYSPSTESTHTDTYTDTEADKDTNKKEEASVKRMPTGRNGLVDSEWTASLKADKTYSGVDVDRELGKMHQWCKIRQLTPSRRRFINWLNRAEKPMNVKSGRDPDELMSDKLWQLKHGKS